MRPLRTLVVVHASLLPPESLEGHSDKEIEEWRTEHDVTAQFAVLRRGAHIHVPRRLRFPLFVKSTVEDASLGIAQASVVEDAAKLKERIEFVHEQVKSDALVEEYIEGRELYVGMMGNERSEEHTSELQSPCNLVCRLLLEKKKSRDCVSCTRLTCSPRP